jgi:hypothetical protein
MNLLCRPYSGWSISYNEFVPKEGTFIKFDSSKTHFYFWLDDFGIPFRGQTVWRPRDIAELAVIEMQLVISPFDPEVWRRQSEPKKWCPIKQIDVYINGMDEENKLLSALPYSRAEHPWVVSFYPKTEIPFLDPLGMSFHINPLWMRTSILRSLH